MNSILLQHICMYILSLSLFLVENADIISLNVTLFLFQIQLFSISLKGRFKVSNSSYSGLLAHSGLQLLNVHVFRNSFTTILKEKQGCNGLQSTKNHIDLTWSWTCITNFADLPWLLKIKSSLRFLRLNSVAKCTQWELFQETGTLWKMGYFYEIWTSNSTSLVLLNSSPKIFENALRPHVNNWHVYMPVVYMLSECILKNVRRTVKKILRTSDAEPDAQIWQKIHHFFKVFHSFSQNWSLLIIN